LGTHPDLAAEQAYIDRAYDSLERARQSATRLRSMVEVGRGGTEQARWEREMIEENIAARLDYLNLGDASLVFGRIDQARSEGGENFYIGRIAVADEAQEPLVVDWRAPVAEPFYRATGRAPMGLVRRRHFATRGRKLLGIEDELFGEGADLLGGELVVSDDGAQIRGQGTLIAALEEARTGRLTDIVATIQGEQDEVIRSPLPGVLVVQGGPGTGKTVVALHRAAYLLYTYRFPLEGQGVLVVGPNRLFLGYIERVLPSLGEAGVELAVLADLVDHVRVRGRDRPAAARIKGDARMAGVVAKAIRDRERALRKPLRVPYGVQTLIVPAERTAEIVADARRRFRLHNAGRRFVESQLYAALAEVSRVPTTPEEVRERARLLPEVREALERMWPVLTPAQLLHDLYGSAALIDLAGRRHLSDDERAALVRPRSGDVDAVVWTHDDVPLLDEARALLGPATRRRRTNGTDPDEIRTYGHIVVDEAQDLSPMQLRMLDRRSLSGSMTVVGDIAQATGVWAHRDWDEILEHLPQRRPAERAELSIGYRIPGPTMDLAAKVLAVAAPDLRPPNSVRQTGDAPRLLPVDAAALADQVAAVAAEERDAVDPGTVAVIAPSTLVDDVAAALERAGIEFGRAARNGLEQRVTLVPVSLVKGLELDAAVVVEPAAIVDEEAQGMRAMYVALTRATRRLAVVHARDLPEPLRS
jgi:DNA helicase IV